MSVVDGVPGLKAAPMVAPGTTELAPGLHALGGALRVDGRISWLPPSARGWQATRTYLLQEGDTCMLIDPGLRYQEDLLIGQLREYIEEGTKISAFLTRSEPDCFGCLERTNAHFPLARILTGGGHNPFDGFEDVNAVGAGARGDVVAVAREGRIAPIPFGEGRELEVLHAPLRINSTFWVYDNGTNTLFSSDAFTHSLADSQAEALEPDRQADHGVEEVRAHLLAKFWWMEVANTQPIINRLREIFAQREIDRICPNHGRPIVGRAAVQKSLGLMIEALTRSLSRMKEFQ